MKTNDLRELLREFIYEEDGIGVVEIILIVVVLIGLVIIFNKELTTLVNGIFNSIRSKSGEITR